MKLPQSVKQNPMYLFLMVLTIAMAYGFQAWTNMSTNLAVDVIGLNGFDMGVIQSVREIPGLLSFAAIFLLLIMREWVVALVMVALIGIGVGFTGMFLSFGGLMTTTFIMSVGFHFFETSNKSLALQAFDHNEAPLVLSKMRSMTAVGNIVAGIMVFTTARYLSITALFFIVGGVILLAVVYLFLFHKVSDPGVPQIKKIVLKKKYNLYYILNIISGTRRQIFVVFALLMLVETYHYTIQGITILFLINNILTWLLSPMMGKWINRYGERNMLTLKYVVLAVVFGGYSFIHNEWIIAILFVFDHLFFSFSICINTYFQKIADPGDMATGTATGFAINHIMAVIVPVVGGAIWIKNPQLPFIAGTILVLFSLIFARMIPDYSKQKTAVL